MQAMSSLLCNPHLSMEPYIQQLMPAIMTCIVRKQLGVRTPQDTVVLCKAFAST